MQVLRDGSRFGAASVRARQPSFQHRQGRRIGFILGLRTWVDLGRKCAKDLLHHSDLEDLARTHLGIVCPEGWNQEQYSPARPFASACDCTRVFHIFPPQVWGRRARYLKTGRPLSQPDLLTASLVNRRLRNEGCFRALRGRRSAFLTSRTPRWTAASPRSPRPQSPSRAVPPAGSAQSSISIRGFRWLRPRRSVILRLPRPRHRTR
jgi:hypothetical protein